MSKLNLYETSWTDIVFENRNKDYGAYHLRQENTKTAFFALLMGISLLTAVISIPMIYNHLNSEHGTIISCPIAELPPLVVSEFAPYVPPKTTEDEAPMPQIESPITDKINTDAQLINPVVVQAALATPDNIASNVDLKNNPSDNISSTAGTGTGTTTSTGTGTGIGTGDNSGITDTSILSSNVVDKKPEFSGGINKFYTYVGNNFEKPEIENESLIRVNVSFVIEKDGSMTDIKVLKDPGYGLGKEAIRVLKSLKTKWIPGIYEGKAVRTSYSLPILIQID
ncbi:energy transducer TonB [Flavobacterium sp. WC2509]|uniref:energy transducer TonB n=1 Tax=Flavobacterium sp. WC2509 TaxID=3461406 RepID=UPI00404514C5